MKKTITKTIAAMFMAAICLLSGCGGNNSSSIVSDVSTAKGDETSKVNSETNAITDEKTSQTTNETQGTSNSETDESKAETEGDNKDKLYIALTFDDGPNTTTTAEVLEKLEKYDIVASFFLVGQNINDDSGKVVKKAFDMGCEINNHSKTHGYMDKMTEEEIKEEIQFTSDAVKKITGKATSFFRPPYIAVNDTMFDVIGMPFISGVGANDWDDRVSAEKRAKTIIKQAKDGGIILLHDSQGNSKTVEALDTIIPDLLEKGYEFVTVTELFKIKGIEISGDSKYLYSNVLQTSVYG